MADCYYYNIYSVCLLLSECEPNSLDEHSRSRHHKHGTLSLLTLDPALPYRHFNAVSKPTFSLILNWHHKHLCIPRRTLWRYTNVVLLLLLLLFVVLTHYLVSSSHMKIDSWPCALISVKTEVKCLGAGPILCLYMEKTTLYAFRVFLRKILKNYECDVNQIMYFWHICEILDWWNWP